MHAMAAAADHAVEMGCCHFRPLGRLESSSFCAKTVGAQAELRS